MMAREWLQWKSRAHRRQRSRKQESVLWCHAERWRTEQSPIEFFMGKKSGIFFLLRNLTMAGMVRNVTETVK